ncbi:uncharacterized protein LOC110606304 [Manihot esculenta]|uniref:uncharacterized protein LOC110606304 n=1 Tax=Manihot esculenta TaxID=3983 RepID=UPI000B5D3645|nr:uncharacterized protein LOC110606304 [Manihot esculenta]
MENDSVNETNKVTSDDVGDNVDSGIVGEKLGVEDDSVDYVESKRKRIGPVTEAQHYDISMDEGCSSKEGGFLDIGSSIMSLWGFIPPDCIIAALAVDLKMAVLATLNLDANKLSGVIPGNLFNSDIGNLNLSKNTFGGYLPNVFSAQAEEARVASTKVAELEVELQETVAQGEEMFVQGKDSVRKELVK